MWDLIDWKGKADSKKEILVNEYDITPYFKNIFQSENTKYHPIIDDISTSLESYYMHVPNLDCIPNRLEFIHAICKLGKGTGIDGIPASVLGMIPQGILNNLLSLIQKTFTGNYPKSWEKQILNAIPKPGHTSLKAVGRHLPLPSLKCSNLQPIFQLLLIKFAMKLQPHMVSHKEGIALQIFTHFMFLTCLVAQMNLVIHTI